MKNKGVWGVWCGVLCPRPNDLKEGVTPNRKSKSEVFGLEYKLI